MDHSPNVLPLLKRWWWVLALAGLLAGAAAYVLASRAEPTYRGEVKLLVGPINATATDLDAAGELGRTYSELAVSRPVLQDAIRVARVRTSVEELRKQVSATSNQISRIVTIGVKQTRPADAAGLAKAIGDQLVRLSGAGPAQESEAIGDFLQQRAVSALDDEARDEIEVAARRAFGESLAGQIQVVDPAQKPKDPVGPMVSLMTLLAGLAGVCAAGVFALVRDSSADSIEDHAALEEVSGTRFLGEIEAPRSRNMERALPVWCDPGRPAADGYRLLAAKVGFLGARPSLGSLTVLDSGDGRTGSVVAANLARVLAEAGWKVLLADANTVGSGVTSLLELEGKPGYADLLRRDLATLNGEFAELLTSPAADLKVLPIGRAASLAQLGADSAELILERLQTNADIVVVSAPPVRRSPAALAWAGVTDGALLAVEGGRTSRDDLTDALGSLALVEAKVVGTVLAHAPGRLGLVETVKSVLTPRRDRGEAGLVESREAVEEWLPEVDLVSAVEPRVRPGGRTTHNRNGESRKPTADKAAQNPRRSTRPRGERRS